VSTGLSALPELAKQINAEHAACMLAAQDAVARAIGVGRLLAEAKGLVRHGEWSGWIEKHCAFGVRQAQKYSQAFHDRASIETQIRTPSSHLTSLNRAIEVVAKPRDDKPKAARQPTTPIAFEATNPGHPIQSMTFAFSGNDPVADARMFVKYCPWGKEYLVALSKRISEWLDKSGV
jgi:hypothetical protein